MVFQINDYVVKVNKGVCRIEDIVSMKLTGEEKEYYLLVPIDDSTAKLYMPVDGVGDNVRHAMTEEEADAFLEEIPNVKMAFIESDKVREQEYKAALKSGDAGELLSIIKNIYVRNRERSLQGKKNTAIDERYCKMAENMLYSELGHALKKSRDEIVSIVMECI